ncbi:FAD-binding domain-containing protein [Xylariaceae sp. FL1272]|nr:FAD-binding domain-containing protein [Xylariaceae sp. FL1272]
MFSYRVLGPLLLSLPLTAAQFNARWDALNATVGGRLHLNTPLAVPCFTDYNGRQVELDEDRCTTIRENYIVAGFRANYSSGYYYSQGEICLSDPSDACTLESSLTPAALPVPGSSCNQGSLPSYYINVQQSSDITAAMAFCNATGIPLAVKNSGHDYQTRSSQKGSLMLWMHNLKHMVHHNNFMPMGCSVGSGHGRAMTVATGVSSQEAVEFASHHNSTILVAYSPEIAISGGWLLGGGHSVLSPVYGLGVDRVVEFKIVTPDGVLRVVNQCQDPHLFWALRGGGSTFGVVLEATHRVEPTLPIAIAHITLPTNASEATSLEWLELMAREALSWGRDGWGGHVAGMWMTHMNPLPEIANLEDNATAAKDSVRKATDFALSVGGTSSVEVLPDFFSAWNKYIKTTVGGASPQVPTSRLIPQSLFTNEEGIAAIMGYFRAAKELGSDPRSAYVPATTPFVAQNKYAGQRPNTSVQTHTSVHPAWYRTLWSITGGAILPWNATYAVRLRNLTSATRLTILSERLTGDAGASYPNEANPFAHSWRKSGWGDNYERLMKVKKQYDPNTLLKCWKCIGFEDEDITTDRYHCLGKLQQDIDATLDE